jgi:hypothetical protein
MDELAATHGERFKAAGILRDAVSSGRKFYP